MTLAEAQADWRDWLKSERRLAAHLGAEHIGILGRGVVAPDRHLGDVGGVRSRLRGQLGHGPVQGPFAMGGIAENWVCHVFHVAAQLVAPPGQGL